MTEAQLDVMLALLKPVVARARATVSPNVTVNAILIEDCAIALSDYRDLLKRISVEAVVE